MTFTYYFTNSRSFSIILNRTRKLFPAPARDCLCLEGLPSWSVTLLSNRTSPNNLPLDSKQVQGLEDYKKVQDL